MDTGISRGNGRQTRTEPAEKLPPARVGSFSLDYVSQRFHWSAEVAAMHGYPAEPMDVTGDFVIAHNHPDDRARIQAMFDELGETQTPLSSRHRIIDIAGDAHDVMVVSKCLVDDAGNVTGIQGFYVDVSAVFDDQVEDAVDVAVDVAVAEFTAHRAVIEQAKGMVMLTYQIPADRAFGVLKWRSQQTNTKVRALCELIVNRAVDEITMADGNRAIFDNLLLNAGGNTLAD